MTENKQGAVRKFVARALAAGVLLAMYAVSTIAVTGVLTAATDTAAFARGGRGGGGARGGGRGRGGGWGRGGGRGRGYWRGGVWVPWVGPLCHRPWSSRRVYCVY